jgi:hypothetical protein
MNVDVSASRPEIHLEKIVTGVTKSLRTWRGERVDNIERRMRKKEPQEGRSGKVRVDRRKKR